MSNNTNQPIDCALVVELLQENPKEIIAALDAAMTSIYLEQSRETGLEKTGYTDGYMHLKALRDAMFQVTFNFKIG